MKRRSRTGEEPIKGRRGKTPERKRCDAPRASAALNEETAVARLTHELREAIEQQSATSEVLRVISSYPDDPEPIFQAMLKNAVRLCDAKIGNIYRWDGDALHVVVGRMIATKLCSTSSTLRKFNPSYSILHRLLLSVPAYGRFLSCQC
jgi:hypothetical protein